MGAETAFIRSIRIYVEQRFLMVNEPMHVLRHNSGMVMALNKRTGREYPVHLGQPGTPDIQILLPARRSLWIETKTPRKGSKLEDSQKAFHALLRMLGHEVVVCRTMPEAIGAIQDALKRAREAANGRVS